MDFRYLLMKKRSVLVGEGKAETDGWLLVDINPEETFNTYFKITDNLAERIMLV